MFRIECFCDDKKLVSTMKALSGLVTDLNVQPVAGAQLKNGKIEATGMVDEVLSRALHHHKKKNFTASEAAAIIVSAGFSKKSTYNAIQKLLDQKLIRRKGKGHYEVRHG